MAGFRIESGMAAFGWSFIFVIVSISEKGMPWSLRLPSQSLTIGDNSANDCNLNHSRHQCLGVLDTLDRPHLADDGLHHIAQRLGLGNGDGIPLPEDQVNCRDAADITDLCQGVGFQARHQLDQNVSFYHGCILYPRQTLDKNSN